MIIKKYIYNLCFGLSKLFQVLKCFVRGGQNFFYLLCVCVCEGGGGGGSGVRFNTSPSVEKITDPLLFIKDWSL